MGSESGLLQSGISAPGGRVVVAVVVALVVAGSVIMVF